VSDWFKIAKDHVVGDARRGDFRRWCYYEGTFSVSTLYYTGVYFKCVYDIHAHTPFRELDNEYSAQLEQQLDRVRDAFDWVDALKPSEHNGLWAPIQDVLGQRFMPTSDQASTDALSYRDMCELLDSGDALRFGPFMRLLDVYWSTLRLGNAQAIRTQLDSTLEFIETRSLRL
jgi:hypothetical protein